MTNREANPRSHGSVRLGRWVEKFWLHLTLLTMAGVFLFPFLWMAGMSVKTDTEATSSALFPDLPRFRASSPYICSADAPARPAGATAAQWNAVLPQLQAAAQRMIRGLPLNTAAKAVDADALRQAASERLVASAVDRLDSNAWGRSNAEVLTAATSLMDTRAAQASLDDSVARLAILGLQVRADDGQLYVINHAADVAKNWSIESGPANMTTDASGSFVRYRFQSGDDTPVVLRADFDLPVPMAAVHRFIVGIGNDDSWHHIDSTLQVDGQTYASEQTYYLAQTRASSLLLQPSDRIESPYVPRTWIPMQLSGPSPEQAVRPGRATLRLTIRPSSTLAAMYGKLERNYLRAFRSVPFWLYVRNSVFLVVMQMAGALFSASFIAYAFARLRWPGRAVAFGVLLSTMMLPAQTTMVPNFLIWKSLGLYNSLTPLWIGAWFGNAFFIFLMTQNMKTIPKELDEAARIDGLNAVQTWWYIIVPQLKPTLAAIAIMTFMGAWNEFMGPLIMLRDQAKFPLSLGLFGMRVDNGGDWTMLMAGNMLMVLPVVIIFFLFQRYFIEGVTATGMKG